MLSTALSMNSVPYQILRLIDEESVDFEQPAICLSKRTIVGTEIITRNLFERTIIK